MTNNEIQKIKGLRATGMSFSAIARKTGRAYSTVYKACKTDVTNTATETNNKAADVTTGTDFNNLIVNLVVDRVASELVTRFMK